MKKYNKASARNFYKARHSYKSRYSNKVKKLFNKARAIESHKDRDSNKARKKTLTKIEKRLYQSRRKS